ncbi:MOB kinase activator-like 1A [Vitis vinifera]|uniref:MOB kinase activator-like 1A n=1 Tax=Vitis vinifera TaxID=29760 RepID=A0A438GCI3_VITVI|nr:MOB kinase activator-like 1A [Vitis vinifera]
MMGSPKPCALYNHLKRPLVNRNSGLPGNYKFLLNVANFLPSVITFTIKPTDLASPCPFEGAQLRKHIDATLGSGNLREAVRLPPGEDANEWLAVNTVDFFNQVNLLYGTLTEFCTPENCPTMTAGPKVCPKVPMRVKGVETKSYADAVKSKSGRVGRGLLLFEFELPSKAERVLARGKRSIKENFLILERWNPKVGCLCKDSFANEAWVRVVGLPLHLWSLGSDPGEVCGKGFTQLCSCCCGVGGAIPFICGGRLHLVSRRWCWRENSARRWFKEGEEDGEVHVLLVVGIKGRRVGGLRCGPTGMGLGEAQGQDKELQVGMTTAAMPLEALEVVERASLTDEALCAASRFGWVVTKGGSFGGLAFVDGGEEQIPLSIILVDGNFGEMASEGGKTMAGEGVGGEVEELLQDLEGKGC